MWILNFKTKPSHITLSLCLNSTTVPLSMWTFREGLPFMTQVSGESLPNTMASEYIKSLEAILRV